MNSLAGSVMEGNNNYYTIVIIYMFFFCLVFFVCSWPAICIHGDKAQNEREWVMEGKL